MGRITIPTIDQIKGSTVMIKMRNLISHFINFAQEVDDNLEEFNTVLQSGAVDYVQADQTNDTVTVKFTMKDGTVKAFNFTSTTGVTLDTVQTILADKTFNKKVFINGQLKVNNTAEIGGQANFKSTVEVESGELIVDDINVKTAIQTLDGETEGLLTDVANIQDRMVTKDGAQTITGNKLFSGELRSDLYVKLIGVDKEHSVKYTPSATYYNYPFVDRGSDELDFLTCFRYQTDYGSTGLCIDVNNVNEEGGLITSKRVEISHDRQGNGYFIVPDVPSGAPSNNVVTKGFVASTDGVTNNILHKDGSENIVGQKYLFGNNLYIGIHNTNPHFNISSSHPTQGAVQTTEYVIDSANYPVSVKSVFVNENGERFKDDVLIHKTIHNDEIRAYFRVICDDNAVAYELIVLKNGNEVGRNRIWSVSI